MPTLFLGKLKLLSAWLQLELGALVGLDLDWLDLAGLDLVGLDHLVGLAQLRWLPCTPSCDFSL